MNKANRRTQVILCVIFSILCLLIVFPFWLLLSASFSSSEALSTVGYQIWPKPIDFSAYSYVFKNPGQILQAYKITFIFSALRMVFSLLMMALVAYPLTKKDLPGRNAINFYLYFTTLFSGGLVPTYILITKFLHLNDTLAVYILPGLLSPWHVFMMRTFFNGIPKEIVESAKIDGASEYKILFSMILPLSKPVLATLGLMVFLSAWNDWNTALIYITKPQLYSLQYLLQKIMEDIKLLQQNQQASAMMQNENIPSESIRMAMAVVVAGPALFIFPFFQKYFVRGLTVGSVKG